MRKLLLLTTFVMSFAGSALAEGIPIKFTLDWKIQGVHGWFYLAKQKGYFAAEGLDVTIDQGEGSAATVSRIMSGACDHSKCRDQTGRSAGYGLPDLQSTTLCGANQDRRPGEKPEES